MTRKPPFIPKQPNLELINPPFFPFFFLFHPVLISSFSCMHQSFPPTTFPQLRLAILGLVPVSIPGTSYMCPAMTKPCGNPRGDGIGRNWKEELSKNGVWNNLNADHLVLMSNVHGAFLRSLP